MPSPLPSAVSVSMDFFDALRSISHGNRATRTEFGSPEIYGIMHDGKLHIRLSDGLLHPWIINDGDMAATDWVVVPDLEGIVTVRTD